MDAVDLAKKFYEIKYDLLKPSEHDRLLKGAQTENEQYFYVELYNLALKFKQDEVIKSGKF